MEIDVGPAGHAAFLAQVEPQRAVEVFVDGEVELRLQIRAVEAAVAREEGEVVGMTLQAAPVVRKIEHRDIAQVESRLVGLDILAGHDTD